MNAKRALRTAEMFQRYENYKRARDRSVCDLCQLEPLETFTHWKIVRNNFPYDAIASTHHMLVSADHLAEERIGPEAWAEYRQIKRERLQSYDCLIESTFGTMSFPTHYHVHLVVGKT